MASDQEIQILRAIQLLGTPTRRGIARFARLSPASVSPYLHRLRERGLVQSAGKSKSSGGRPSVKYRLSPSLGCTIGVFFETSVCQLVAADLEGTTLAERALPLSLPPHSGSARIVEVIASEVAALRGFPAVKDHPLLALGIAAPGMVDTENGLWLHGLRLSGIEHVRLGSLVEAAAGVPVLIEDEARCLAWLEVSRTGAAGGLLLVYLGTGVGAGLVIDGQLYRGHRGLAGEVGHLVVEEHGERCACGNAGCLETVASLPAVLRRFQKRLDEGVVSSLQRPGASQPLTLDLIRQAAEAGDRLALVTIAEIGRAVGEACGKSIMILNPRTLCIGGPVAALGEFLRPSLWARVREQVMPEMIDNLELRYAAFSTGDEALGAAMLAARWFWSNLTMAKAGELLNGASVSGRT
jgi:predicted NBD/HSP70 family sugar kinase